MPLHLISKAEHHVKTITLIVPTYNMEAYLPHCLDSLMPVAEEGDLEVVVMNDGSTDRSREIAESYRLRLPAAIVLIDKENGGYGSGVNAGLKVATGRYVKLLDADDWMETDALREVIAALRDMQTVDLVLTPFNVCFPDGRTATRGVSLPTGEVLSADKYWRDKTMQNLMHQFFMYRRQMLTDSHYVQLEHCLYTDAQWSFTPMASVQTICAFSSPLYQYRAGRPGQSVDPAVKRLKFADDVRKTQAMACDFAAASFSSVAMRKCLEAKLEKQALRLFRRAIILGWGNGGADVEPLDDTLRQCAPTVWTKLGRRFINRLLPIRFIGRWRRDHQDPILRLGVRLHRALHGE